jgi:hypothetical protein
MVAVRESAYDCLRECFCVETHMGNGSDLVLSAVIEEDGNTRGEALREIGARRDVIACPSTFTDEWRGDQEYAADLCAFGNCSATT